MHKLPLARNHNILIQPSGNELLIYDLDTNKAFCLNKTLTIVYQACDGKISFDELKRMNNFADEIIFLAIAELKKVDLIEQNDEFANPFNGLSRREIIKRAALSSMIAIPIISSIIVPTAAYAQSCGAKGSVVIGTGDPGNAVQACANGTARCCNGNAGVFSNCHAGDSNPCQCEVTCA